MNRRRRSPKQEEQKQKQQEQEQQKQQEQQEQEQQKQYIPPAQLWLEDMNRDVDISTGYLIKEPQGNYGKKVRELVNHAISQSSEVKAIQNSRKSKTHPFITYSVQICTFLAEYVLPILIAFTISYMYYKLSDRPELNNVEPQKQTQTSPSQSQPYKYRSTKPDTSMRKAIETGGFAGDLVHRLLSIPVGFLLGFADKGFRISEIADYMMESSRAMIYTPMLFIIVYFTTLFLFRFLLNLYTLWLAETTLWSYQEIVLIETERILERAITGIMRPHLMDYYHAFLGTITDMAIVNQVQQLRRQYNGRDEGAKNAIIDRLTHSIKTRDFTELMRLGHVSPEYLNGVHMLIRHADEALSKTMFNFNRQLADIPTTMNPIHIFASKNVVVQ